MFHFGNCRTLMVATAMALAWLDSRTAFAQRPNVSQAATRPASHWGSECDPYYPGLHYPKLTTPQWMGDEGVEAAVVLAIDDMRGHPKWETYLRPILDRLKQIDGKAPVSIMTCQIEPTEPHLQTWLAEGLNLDCHTIDHPCPLLKDGDLEKARSTYERCVELLARVPGNRPVAFRMPCCDSRNTVSPRFYREIFDRVLGREHNLVADSSAMNVLTSDDPALPRELVLDADGQERFTKYLPRDQVFANTIQNYPYPYRIGRTCWEFPCVVPSDWSAQNHHRPFNPQTVADWKAALDAVVIKQGVFCLVFHPYEWIRPQQVVELIDYAVAKHGRKIKFLNFRDAVERLQKTFPASANAHRDADTALWLDLNHDGYLDAVELAAHPKANDGGPPRMIRASCWSPKEKRWHRAEEPTHAERLQAGPLPDGTTLLLDPLIKEASAFVFANDALRRVELVLPKPTSVSPRFRDVDRDGTVDEVDARRIHFGALDSDGKVSFRAVDAANTLPDDIDLTGPAVRFADIDEDGFDDLLISDEHRSALYLFDGKARHWSRKVFDHRRGDGDAPVGQMMPPFVVKGPNTRAQEMGAWLHQSVPHQNAIVWQNEHTATLPGVIDRRTSAQLLGQAEMPARTAAEAIHTLHPRTGFLAELVAAELLIMDPVAFEWGGDGRLWVAEMADYPLGVDGKGTPGGRVRFLRDTDGDGRLDQSTLFLEGLAYPNGVLPWRNGVLVSAAPEIFYAEDTDGDGKADRRETLFVGFHEGNQQHRVNGLVWGIDNWVYCANGDSGGKVRSIKTGVEVNIQNRDFRIRPDEGAIELQTGMTQHGRCQDDAGNWFGCNNSNPLYHFALADEYLARNRHFAPNETRIDVPILPGAAPVFPASRTFARFNDHDRANRFTSVCGQTIYRDTLFGPAFAGNAFIAEPVHNLVHREVITPKGTTFTSRRASDEATSEFLGSSDNWFRPTMIKTGPDGTLWIADMYRHVIEHPEWIPRDWQARLDLRAGHDKGRIYRVFPAGVSPRPIPRFDTMTTDALVMALESPNGWQRDTVQRTLIERRDPAARVPLNKLLAGSKLPLARLHALATLAGLNELDEDALLRALGDPDPVVVRHGVRWSESLLAKNASRVVAKITALADRAGELPPPLLMQLAYSLGAWSDPTGGEALAKIALAVPDDRFLTAAAFSSIRDENIGPLVRAVADSAYESHANDAPSIAQARQSHARRLLGRLLAQAALRGRAAEVTDAVARLGKLPPNENAGWRLSALRELQLALARDNKALAQDELGIMNEMAHLTVLRGDADESDRIAGVGVLGFVAARRGRDLQTLAELLAPQVPQGLQLAAAARLAEIEDDRAVESLLANWEDRAPQLRRAIVSSLIGRPARAVKLLEAVASGSVPRGEIDAGFRRQLVEHPREEVRQAANKVLGEAPVDADRKAVVDRYVAALAQAKPDKARGGQIFRKTCSQCHRLGETGHAVGPDIAALRERSPEYLLTAMLDPNRAIEVRYLNFVATGNDGLVYTGLVKAETATSIVLVGPEAKEHVLLRTDLESLRSTGKSLMPDGLEKEIAPEAAADLLAFLGDYALPVKKFPGNEPRLVPTSADGRLYLLASQAEIVGPSIVFENQFENLGYWGSELDQATWTIDVAKAGKYRMQLNYACPPETAGNVALLSVAGKNTSRKIESTGSWERYVETSFGAIELPAGKHRLVVRSEGPIQGHLFDLKEVKLLPKKE